MPCGNKPLVKLWDHSKDLKTIKPSRYQQNEASVKVHWKQVIKDLEMFYQDAKFWETQGNYVRELVGPVIYERLAKIFTLPLREKPYEVPSVPSIVVDSEDFYQLPQREGQVREQYSTYEYADAVGMEGEGMEEQSEWEKSWSATSASQTSGEPIAMAATSRHKQLNAKSKSLILQAAASLTMSKGSFKTFSKVLSKLMSRTFNKSLLSYQKAKSHTTTVSTAESSPNSEDDVLVQARSKRKRRSVRRSSHAEHSRKNPHFDMLYCSESVTDMIKWPSRMYERRTFDLEASDEYSKKAELLTKQIALSFYEWWISVGSPDYKSEVKRPKDIEELFQVWFDEHASRGLVLDPKILPCVLQTIADFVGLPDTSCPRALKRQIAWDVWAETSPAHTRAFNSSLPHHMKHIPPKNNTAENWHPVRIPEDLKSMDCVWKDISYLTSTKTFQKWLERRPYMPMPPCLKRLTCPDEKKALFVIPSDFVFGMDADSDRELTIPVSKFHLELKDVISKLLND